LTGCLEAGAALAAVLGQPARALRLAGAVEALREPLGAALPPDWRSDFARLLMPARRALGEDATAGLWADGRTLSLDQALAEVGMVTRDGGPPAATRATATGHEVVALTPREREVLRLVTAGQSNREIAATLSIESRTVAWHLENLYAKLGLDSRAAAAAYATRHGLA
jgi:DNA-binding CsgD family transcriptional regulator